MMRIRLFWISLVLVSAVLTACSDNPGVRLRYQAEKLLYFAERESQKSQIRPQMLDSAKYHELRNNYREAVEFCYDALDSLPPRMFPEPEYELNLLGWQAGTRLSQLYYTSQMYDSSIAVLEKMMTRLELSSPARISTYLNYGRALQSAGMWDSALTVYTMSTREFYPPIDSSGEVIPYLYNLPITMLEMYEAIGDSAAADSQYSDAIDYYEDLVSSAPNTSLAAHTNLASLYGRRGQWENALNEIRSLVDSAGRLYPAARLRSAGILSEHMGRYEAALAEYEKLLADLKGRDTLQRPLILFEQSQVLIELHQYDSARRILSDLRYNYSNFFDQTPEAQHTVARSYELQGNWDRAETEYKYLIEQYPGAELTARTYVYLAERYTATGRMTEARRMEERAMAEYERMATIRPGTIHEARALSYKADLFRRKRDWQGAVTVLSELFDKFPRTDIGQQALVTASVVYRDKLNDPERADSLVGVLKRFMTVEEGVAN